MSAQVIGTNTCSHAARTEMAGEPGFEPGSQGSKGLRLPFRPLPRAAGRRYHRPSFTSSAPSHARHELAAAQAIAPVGADPVVAAASAVDPVAAAGDRADAVVAPARRDRV